MRAVMLYGAGDVRVEDVPDVKIAEPTDAIIRVTLSCICGSDLHPFHNAPASETGTPMGHEMIGIVEQVGTKVASFREGDLVVVPFSYQDGVCRACRAEHTSSCVHGGFWSQFAGGQGQLARVPLADTSLFKLPVGPDSELLPSLLTLSDVYSTAYHAALKGGVTDGSIVTVVGDGAVGLLSVLASIQRGAERVILMGRHPDRTAIGLEFGASDIVTEREAEGVEKVKDLTDGGTEIVIDAVGMMTAYQQALGIVTKDGTVSRIGVPQYEEGPIGSTLFTRNITLTGGVAHVAAYVDLLMPAILDGTVNPGRVFDRTVTLDDVPAGYEAMDDRKALKILVTPNA